MCWGGGACHRLVWPQFHVAFKAGPCCSSERLSLMWNFQGWWNSAEIRRLWNLCSNLFGLELGMEKAGGVLILAIHFLFVSAYSWSVQFSQCRRSPRSLCTHHLWCWVLKGVFLWCWAGVRSLPCAAPCRAALGGIWAPQPEGLGPGRRKFTLLVSFPIWETGCLGLLPWYPLISHRQWCGSTLKTKILVLSSRFSHF